VPHLGNRSEEIWESVLKKEPNYTDGSSKKKGDAGTSQLDKKEERER